MAVFSAFRTGRRSCFLFHLMLKSNCKMYRRLIYRNALKREVGFPLCFKRINNAVLIIINKRLITNK